MTQLPKNVELLPDRGRRSLISKSGSPPLFLPLGLPIRLLESSEEPLLEVDFPPRTVMLELLREGGKSGSPLSSIRKSMVGNGGWTVERLRDSEAPALVLELRDGLFG